MLEPHCSEIHNERRRSNGLKLRVEIMPWHGEKYFSFCSMSNDGNDAQRFCVGSTLKIFKTQVDLALSTQKEVGPDVWSCDSACLEWFETNISRVENPFTKSGFYDFSSSLSSKRLSFCVLFFQRHHLKSVMA